MHVVEPWRGGVMLDSHKILQSLRTTESGTAPFSICMYEQGEQS